MAKHQTASQRKKTIFCFTVACFKCAGEAPHDCKPQQGRPDATIRRWLCWSRRRKLIKTSAAKTVPVDGSPSAASTTNTLVRSKIKKFPLIGSKGRGLEAERHRSTAEEDSESGDRRVQETKAAHHNVAMTVDPTESEIANTCPPRNLLTDGNLVADRAATGVGVQTGSSYQLRLTPTVRSAVMSPSSSSPPHPTTPKPLLKTAAGKKLEPVVGMSVIMVTLVVMIMWGRLYAILCTSACLYFIPKFRPREGSGGLRRLNLDSHGGLGRREAEEYKKKVVLEGLLERNRRR